MVKLDDGLVLDKRIVLDRIDVEQESQHVPKAQSHVDIKGIGHIRVQKLQKANIITIGDLLNFTAKEISDKTDISERRIIKWQKQAEEFGDAERDSIFY